MWPKLLHFLLIVLISTSATNGVRRKSKIDLPIANAADAPFTDNIAQSSTNQQVTKNEAPLTVAAAAAATAATEKPINSIASAATNGNQSPASTATLTDNSAAIENDGIECDPDMIGFEIITGLVSIALHTNRIWGLAKIHINRMERNRRRLESHKVSRTK